MNKIELIRKSLRGLRRYQVMFVVSVMLGMFVFSYYLIMNDTTEMVELKKIKNTYGSYTYTIEGVSAEKVKKIEEDTNTKRCLFVEREENDEATFMFVEKEFFSFTNYSIIEGVYPQSSEEILVPAWYLFQLDVDLDNVLGSSIITTDSQTGGKIEKKVSGIYTIQQGEGISSEWETMPTFIAGKEGVVEAEYYDIYVELNSLVDIDNYLTELRQRILLEDNENIILNKELLNQIGATGEGKSELRKKIAIYSFLVLILVILMGMIQRTVIFLSLERWKKILSIYKLLGVNMNELRSYILTTAIFQTFIGMILGSVCGYGMVYLLVKTSIFHWGILHGQDVCVSVPYEKLLVCSILLLCLTIVIICIVMKKFDKNAAYGIVTEENKSRFFVRHSLFLKGRLRRSKYAISNTVYCSKQKLGIMVTVVLCVVLVVFLDVQLKQEIKNVDNNNQYEFRFDVIDYYNAESEEEIQNTKQVYEKLVAFLEQKGKTIYYKADYVTEFDLEKELLTQEYIEKLKTYMNGYMQYMNSKPTIDSYITIMGYSIEMLKEMFGDDFRLGKDEIVLLNRTVDNQRNNSVSIVSAVGKKYNFETFLFLEKEQSWVEIEKTVGYMVENLPVYPMHDKETLCIIMNLDEYNKYFNQNFVNPFYVKELDESEVSFVKDALKGVKTIQVINQKKEFEIQRMNYEQKKFLLYMILILCNFFAGINLLLQEIHEMDIRKKDFDFLQVLGISKKDCSLIILLELILANFLGVILGIALCKACMLVLYDMAIIQSTDINEYILVLSFGLSLFYTIMSYIVVRKILFKINEKINWEN